MSTRRLPGEIGLAPPARVDYYTEAARRVFTDSLKTPEPYGCNQWGQRWDERLLKWCQGDWGDAEALHDELIAPLLDRHTTLLDGIEATARILESGDGSTPEQAAQILRVFVEANR